MTALEHGKTIVLYELIVFGLIVEGLWVGVLRNELDRGLDICSAVQASVG